jgi:hypothetical protein
MDLVEFFIQKGATDWDASTVAAARKGHKALVELFIQKGATNLPDILRNSAYSVDLAMMKRMLQHVQRNR